MKKSIIVGYDPGTTAAVAIIDTNKKILFLTSKKGLKVNDIIKEISKIGTTLIVATDKIPIPKNVEKLNNSLGAKIFFPSESLSTTEKWSLIKDCKIKIKNDHERDALASAIKAYEKYSKLFKKIDRVLSSLYLSELYDKVLKMLIKEEAENITDAVEKIMKKMKKPEKSKKKIIKETPNKKVQELKEIIKQKNDDIEILKSYNESLKEKLKKYEEKYGKRTEIKIDINEIKQLKDQINKLKEKIEEKNNIISKLKLFRELENKNYIPIIEISGTTESIQEFSKKFSLINRVVLLKNTNQIETLNDYNIKAAIIEKIDENIIGKLNFPIILKDDISLKKINNILVIEKKEFENKISKARKIGFIKWLKNYKKRKV